MRNTRERQSGDSRETIVQYIMDEGLVETCVKYRLNKCRDPELKKEMVQETYLWLLTYDLDKLRDAWVNKHLSALITRFICNQFFSKTSAFYRQFKRFDLCTDEITPQTLNIPDG